MHKTVSENHKKCYEPLREAIAFRAATAAVPLDEIRFVSSQISFNLQKISLSGREKDQNSKS